MSKNKKYNSRFGGSRPPSPGGPFKGANSHIHYSIEDRTPKLINTACRIPDINQGREQLIRLMKSAFDAKFEGDSIRLAREIADLEADYQVTLDQLSEARDINSVTPEYMPAVKPHDSDDVTNHTETEWAFWQTRHKIESGVIAGALPIALGASALTAHANLVGTGLPVFLGNPILPVSMAMLAPMASISFKTIWHSLRSERARAAFTRYLNYTAVGLSVGWALLFADQFHGLSAGPIGNDIFTEPSSWHNAKETGFTAVTLLTEMTLGTVLAHRLDKIAERYSPNSKKRNPESEVIQERIVTLETRAKTQSTSLARLIGERAEYPPSLTLQVELACLAYDARRASFDEETI